MEGSSMIEEYAEYARVLESLSTVYEYLPPGKPLSHTLLEILGKSRSENLISRYYRQNSKSKNEYTWIFHSSHPF